MNERELTSVEVCYGTLLATALQSCPSSTSSSPEVWESVTPSEVAALVWPLMVIQTALSSDPERIAAILEEDARIRVDEPDEVRPHSPEDELTALSWSSEWRRAFG